MKIKLCLRHLKNSPHWEIFLFISLLSTHTQRAPSISFSSDRTHLKFNPFISNQFSYDIYGSQARTKFVTSKRKKRKATFFEAEALWENKMSERCWCLKSNGWKRKNIEWHQMAFHCLTWKTCLLDFRTVLSSNEIIHSYRIP